MPGTDREFVVGDLVWIPPWRSWEYKDTVLARVEGVMARTNVLLIREVESGERHFALFLEARHATEGEILEALEWRIAW
jgi:hypothetical protein